MSFHSLFSRPTKHKDEVGWDEVEWNGVEWFHSIPPGSKTKHILGAQARDRKSTRLNSSHITRSRMPSSA